MKSQMNDTTMIMGLLLLFSPQVCVAWFDLQEGSEIFEHLSLQKKPGSRNQEKKLIIFSSPLTLWNHVIF